MNIMRTAIAAAAVGLMGSIALAQTAKISPQEFATMAASSDLLESVQASWRCKSRKQPPSRSSRR